MHLQLKEAGGGGQKGRGMQDLELGERDLGS